MNETTAIVPLNVSKLETIPVDRARRINADDKKRAFDWARKIIGERMEIVNEATQKVRAKALAEARKASGWDAMDREYKAIQSKIDGLVAAKERLIKKQANQTGFDSDGDLMPFGSYGYDPKKDDYKEARVKARAVHESVELQVKVIGRMSTKFDKVEARIILCSTNGELMDIMESLVGNGDGILDAPDVEV